MCVWVYVGQVHVCMCAWCVHMCKWKGRKQRGQIYVYEMKQEAPGLVMRMCVPSLRTTSPTRARKIWDYRGCVCSCRAGLCFQQPVKCWTSETLRPMLIPLIPPTYCHMVCHVKYSIERSFSFCKSYDNDQQLLLAFLQN